MRQISTAVGEASPRPSGRVERVIELQRRLSSADGDLAAAASAVADAALASTGADGVLIGLGEEGLFVVRGTAGTVAGHGVELEVGDALPDVLLDECARAVVRNGSAVGAIVAFSSAAGRFSERDRETLELLAMVLGAAVGRSAELEAREEAAEALARFELMLDRAPIGIGLMGRDGCFVLANPAMCAITGFSAKELARMPVSEYALPEDFEEISSRFGDMFAGVHDSYSHEHRLRSSEGGIVWVDASLSLLPESSGKPKYAIVMAQDVTRRRVAEERVREAEKIEAVGLLAAGVAHDFNNLLMAMLGYATLARAEIGNGTLAGGHLAMIEESAERAAGLTRQLLAFGRKQALQIVEVDLNALIKDALAMVRSLLGPTIALELNLDPELPLIEADASQLQQVILNLALNARDAMPDGGTLSIRTDGSASGEPSRVLLSLSDTGCGMEPEVRARIFEPFFTTKEGGSGTGLGMSSAYGIIKQSRGEIEVESTPGSGSSFRIHLPAGPQATTADAVQIDVPPPIDRDTSVARDACRILVVEDQPDVRKLIGLLLSENGYQVTDTPDAEAALELVAGGEEFDLVITDIVLPGIDGVTLGAQLHTSRPDLPVLYMSGYQREHRVDPALLLSKPFNLRDLLEKIKTLSTV